MRFRGWLLAVALLLGLTETFIVASEPFWFLMVFKPTTPADASNIAEGFNVASLLIDPAVVFMVMFLMGRNVDPAGDFGRTMGSLLVGSLLGTYGCLLSLAVYSYYTGLMAAFMHQFELDLLYDAFGALRLALVAFSGLAISHLARTRKLSSPPIEP